MSLAQFSDRMVFALSMVGAPHLQRIRHPGHSSLLVRWTRAADGIGTPPCCEEVLDGMSETLRNSLAIIAPLTIPHQWKEIGPAAATLVRRYSDDQTILGSILAQGPIDQPRYHENAQGGVTLGVLRVPVTESRIVGPIWLIGIQVLAAHIADIGIMLDGPCSLPEQDFH